MRRVQSWRRTGNGATLPFRLDGARAAEREPDGRSKENLPSGLGAVTSVSDQTRKSAHETVIRNGCVSVCGFNAR